MKPAPKNWPRLSTALYYRDPRAAIEWLVKAFGFEVRLIVEGDNGSIRHSELSFGEGLIMVSAAVKEDRSEWSYRRSPLDIDGGNTQSLQVYVDDAEEHFKKAQAAGAKIVSELKTVDYGEGYWSDRIYEAADLEGHHFWFSQRLRG